MILFNCLAWNLRKIEDDEIIRQDIRRSLYGRFSFYDPSEVDINKKTENQAKMTKLSMEWKRLCKINAKVRVNTEESAVKPEPELKNTIECNLNPSDGPGKPNSIIMKTVKTKWALNQLQQPICVQLTKTVKTLKAQS
ncbi:hypothetical protein Tco_0133216 [Tanacetum coccineum]|uniref:Uncharacterized protein n=1 Tax=Tanacetum coccineum TaxID=301880 RepID=A0ABQ5EX08_9ASTR